MKIAATFKTEFHGGTIINTNAVRCKKHKMTNTHGRSWNVIGKLEDGTDIYADTAWGFYGFFYTNGGQWYKFRF